MKRERERVRGILRIPQKLAAVGRSGPKIG
jgi:hypothetical protein